MATKITVEEAARTKQVCTELDVPSSFRKIKDISIEKSTHVVYSMNYQSDEEPSRVDDYFTKSLSEDGWEVTAEIGSTTSINASKGNQMIQVQYERYSFTQERIFMVSCSLGLRR